MDRGAWQATVHSVAKSWTQLSDLATAAAAAAAAAELFSHYFGLLSTLF